MSTRSRSSVSVAWPMLAPLLGIAACQVIDDIRYRPKVGPLVPDAMTLTGVCPIIPGDPCGDSNLTAEVSFSRDIQPRIHRTTPDGCMSHTLMPTQPTVLFDVSTYSSLRKGGVHSGANIIADCRPCDSILVQKLSDRPPFGAQMPMTTTHWSDVDMTLLRDWIAEGARDN